MASTNLTPRRWNSSWGFLFAAIGFAVGLGNIWRFPYVTGMNGGSAFLFIYLGCVLCVGLPLLVAELTIGRKGRANPPSCFRSLAQSSGKSESWSRVGAVAVFCIFVLTGLYSIITSWTFDYFYHMVSGSFVEVSADASGSQFATLLSSPLRLVFWHTMVCILVATVVSQGVNKGIERVSSVMIPLLLVSLVLLVIFGFVAGDASAGLSFLFVPDFEKVTAQTVMLALGQAFFSIGIGVAGMITFGSYLPSSASIPRAALIIVAADAAVALLAGMAIFPIAFGYGLEPASGPSLIFQSLPIAFGNMPGGQFFGSVFFLLLIFAAFTSCVGCGEALISWARGKFGIDRKKTTTGVMVSVWGVGLIYILSLNEWSDIRLIPFLQTFENKNIFDTVEYIASNVLLLSGAFLTAVFAGWVARPSLFADAMGGLNSLFFRFWYFSIRYLIPPVLLLSLTYGISE